MNRKVDVIELNQICKDMGNGGKRGGIKLILSNLKNREIHEIADLNSYPIRGRKVDIIHQLSSFFISGYNWDVIVNS